MNAKDREASKLLMERIRELEEIIAGDRRILSNPACGLCSVYEGVCMDCPARPCSGFKVIKRRARLSFPNNLLSSQDKKKTARQHLKWLLAVMKSNGWEYDYE